MNQDRVVARPDLGLWAVADGAGGHGNGERAAQAIADALDSLPAGFSAAELLAMVRYRLLGVHADLQSDPLHMGMSTVVVLLIRGGYFAALWAGDSRIYLLRDGKLRRITHDHSLVQELVDAGDISEAEAEQHPRRNVITRAVGQPEPLVLEKVAERLVAGDRFLLCSDGLFKDAVEDVLASMLAQGADADMLVLAAIRGGGQDNISAVVVGE